MRKVIGLRYPLGSVPIKDIELDAESRDDIPAILIGLQAVYRNEAMQRYAAGLRSGNLES